MFKRVNVPIQTKKELNCNADPTNNFYGNRGALLCLRDEGDVAILEAQDLQGYHINRNN